MYHFSTTYPVYVTRNIKMTKFLRGRYLVYTDYICHVWKWQLARLIVFNKEEEQRRQNAKTLLLSVAQEPYNFQNKLQCTDQNHFIANLEKPLKINKMW